jgi:3-phenylpropionate/trans-cinnamate dioxygenase ferredoxin reductase subunit
MHDTRVDTLLIGGGVASVRCARALRRHGHKGAILIAGDEPHLPYNRPPLSKELMRDEVPFELVAAEPAEWFERRGIELRTDAPTAGLDTAGRRATLADGTRIGYERCLIAIGAAPRRPPIPGAEHALLLRTIDDALAIRRRAVAGARAILIGGGFIGVEVAASLAARGLHVTVVEMAPALWAGQLGSELSDWAGGVLTSAGVSLRLATPVTGIEPEAVRLGDERLAADLIVAGVGVAPRDAIALEAGLAVSHGIVADASQATSADGVWAAGDVARVAGSRVEHWHAAREGGERAALAMLGLPVPARRAPWVFSEFAGQQLDVVGDPNIADDLVTIGDVTSESFAVGFVRNGVAVAVGIVNAAIPVDDARRSVEERTQAADLTFELTAHLALRSR